MGLVLGFLRFGASGSSAKVPALNPSRLIVLLVQRLTSVSTMGVALFLRLGVAVFARGAGEGELHGKLQCRREGG